MKTAFLSTALLIAGSLAIPAYQDTQSAGQDMKDAGTKTKNAAKDVGSGTKKAAKKTGHAVKKGANKAATATEKGADKVAGKTADTNPK
jgi:predicted small secreted protein